VTVGAVIGVLKLREINEILRLFSKFLVRFDKIRYDGCPLGGIDFEIAVNVYDVNMVCLRCKHSQFWRQ
jgi:hypothetical protein